MLLEAQRIVIVTHMGPDGDALGSALGLYHWLTNPKNDQLINSPEVHVIVPNAYPGFLSWMPDAADILVYETQSEPCNAIIANADLIVCTDFNDPRRIGPIGEKMLKCECPKLLIDHHIIDTPTEWVNLVFSYPESPSASEIVYRLIREWNNGPLTELMLDAATCLYTGMMTDTGNFSFNSNHPEMYEIIAELVRAGVNKDAVYDAVFNQHSENRMRLWAYALYRKMRIYPDFHLSLIILSADELERYNYQVGDTEGLVNQPMQIHDVYYSVFIREERAKPGTPLPRIRLSFRSKGDRPVNVFANEIFRGGGHKNAAGGDLYGSIGQAVRMLERNMAKYLKRD